MLHNSHMLHFEQSNYSAENEPKAVPSCRDTLSEVLRLLRGLPHRLLRLPAVLHGQAELGLHLLLQHPALQRPQEEAPRSLSGNAGPPRRPADSSLRAPDAPSYIELHCTVLVVVSLVAS